MDKIKVLNLYAGIGGNRKLWENVDVTAVELNPKIAKIYQDFFPDDKVIVTDAHQYLLEHYQEFDFIWSSPPCPSHSRMRFLKNNFKEAVKKYPDMQLYEEIIYLKHFFKGKWVVENVISYYEPLIIPLKSDNHYFWSNFIINAQCSKNDRGIRGQTPLSYNYEYNGFDLSNLDIPNSFKKNVLNNCVKPELGYNIFTCAFPDNKITLKDFTKQLVLA